MKSFYTHTGEKPSQVSQETYNDLKSKEKSAARVDPKPSHDPRNPRKADLRREIDAWSLLVWPYKDECVRAAAGGTEDWSLRHERSSLCMAERRGGLINGWLQVHEDAVAVDAWVRNLSRHGYWLIVDHAEKGEMPSRVVKLPPLKCRPVLRQTSAGPKPKMLRHPRTHEPYICLVEFVGYSVEEISKAHAEADARVDRLGDCLMPFTTVWLRRVSRLRNGSSVSLGVGSTIAPVLILVAKVCDTPRFHSFGIVAARLARTDRTLSKPRSRRPQLGCGDGAPGRYCSCG